jgi:catalase (peroxidase I)
LTWADFIQVAGARAVEATGGPKMTIPLGRPDVRKGDPAGQLPASTLDAKGLEDLFMRNGYTLTDIVALSGSHSIGSSRANDPKGPMTPTPTKFDNSYFKLLLKGGGAFPSDRALVAAPETKALVQKFARDQGAFFDAFAAAYIKMGLKGLAA